MKAWFGPFWSVKSGRPINIGNVDLCTAAGVVSAQTMNARRGV